MADRGESLRRPRLGAEEVVREHAHHLGKRLDRSCEQIAAQPAQHVPDAVGIEARLKQPQSEEPAQLSCIVNTTSLLVNSHPFWAELFG